ncbi:MAG: hypothetical protein OJF49_003517 [Ktedonobacterales bacterium]|jgi:predicted phosphodiesterase|nr:MAG: hypothetical protein OJF49_003517 [Ktedonobacterales bacterium]
MRILVISDMHGNCLALDTVLSDIAGERFDATVCLGDTVQGGPQPHEVIARLRDLNCPVVMGNADDWMLTGHDTGAEEITPERRQKMDAVREWSLAQLSPDDVAFIQAYQPTVRMPLGDGLTLVCSHGSPKSYDDLILPTTTDEELQQLLQPEDGAIYCGGHTHVQFVRHLRQTFHFNPGSAGFAYRHDQDDDHFKADPFAEYAVLTSANGSLRLEFRRVPFDAEQLIAIYRSSGRPYAEEAAAQYIPA